MDSFVIIEASVLTLIDTLIQETKPFRKEHPQNDDLTIVAVCVE